MSLALLAALLAAPLAHAGMLPSSARSAPLAPLMDDLATPVRHALTISARGFERRWVRQVRGLLETRFDVDALPMQTPLTIWTAEDDIVAFEVGTPAGDTIFATRVALERDGGISERWILSDGSTLDGPVLARPVRTQTVSSKLGPRAHPVYGYRKFHAGTDYTAPTGTPVHAIADGRVVYAGHALTAGNFVILEHSIPGDDGLESRYMHLNRITPGVVTGSFVRQGDVIGQVGQTGVATGPHLHFEVRDGWGTLLDPLTVTWPGHELLDTPQVLHAVTIRRALLETYELDGMRDLFARILFPPGDVDQAPDRVEIRGAFALLFAPPRPTSRRARLVEQPGRRRRRQAGGRDALAAA